MTTEGVRGLAEVLVAAIRVASLGPAAPEVPARVGDATATAALAWFDARLGSGEVVEAVAEAITESPNGPWLTLPGPVSIAPSIAAAAVEAVRAALREGE